MTAPLIIAHRGASGYRPEHTAAAYELAARMGADYIEPDLVMTKDGVLVDRHEPEISGTTDVSDHPEFAARRTTKLLDGVATTGWFTEDFTLAELKTLRARERLPQVRPANTAFDGQQEVLTYEEVLTLREKLSIEHGRTIGVIPEIKHSTYLHNLGLDPEEALVEATRAHGLDQPDAPLWVQSFEHRNLLDLRATHGFRGKLTFLVEAFGAPYDFVAGGDGRTYADLCTTDALTELASAVDAISPNRSLILPETHGHVGPATSLVADAHRVGLQVIPWTVRAENAFLPEEYRTDDGSDADEREVGRVVDFLVRLFETDIDGLFVDQPDLACEARERFLARRGHAGRTGTR